MRLLWKLLSKLMAVLLCFSTALLLVVGGTGITEVQCRVLEPQYVQCDRSVSLLYHLIRPAPDRFRLTGVEVQEVEKEDDDGDTYYSYEVYLQSATAPTQIMLGSFTASRATQYQRALLNQLSGETTDDFVYKEGGAFQMLLITAIAVGITGVGSGATLL